MGITPAYAGKSEKSADGLICARDHPRVCGEKPTNSPGGEPELGSPPRMRGKAPYWHDTYTVPGITPAYAGKSMKNREWQERMRDHPRVCGEKHQLLTTINEGEGSPPRMRGKGVVPCIQRRLIGITPAYAGKSIAVRSFYRFPRDHPRVCGEKYRQNRLCLCSWGSPPRMRGKDSQGCKGGKPAGITPAYAGKSNPDYAHTAQAGDHPRVCGEKANPLPANQRAAGSPPRMRGKAIIISPFSVSDGITPAYAGKSSGCGGARSQG